jgi:hypothetical protein
LLGALINSAPRVVGTGAPLSVEDASSTFTVVVTYDDDNGLDTATFGNANIVLTGATPACM